MHISNTHSGTQSIADELTARNTKRGNNVHDRGTAEKANRSQDGGSFGETNKQMCRILLKTLLKGDKELGRTCGSCWGSILVCFLLLLTNTVAKGNLRRKGFLWLTHLEHSITERRESRNSRKEPGGGN